MIMKNFSPENGHLENREREIIRVVSDFEDERGEHPVIEVDKNAAGLFLFDIDGTLIDARKIHGPAAITLFRETFGGKFHLPFDDKEFTRRFIDAYVSHWGLGDRREFELLCIDFGITLGSEREKETTLDSMTARYGSLIEASVRDSSPEEREAMFLPGVLPFLEEMQKRGIPAALVTGNVRKSAEAFAKHIGFGKYFVAGGFDDDPTVTDEPYRRASILQSAVEKCRAKGLEFLPQQMAVFGDTPKDFEATLHQGDARPYTFLFATGDRSLHTLAEVTGASGTKRPWMVLPSFANIKLKDFFDSLERYRTL